MLKNINSIKGGSQRTLTLLIMSTRGFEGFENAKLLSSYFGSSQTETISGTSIKGKPKITKKGNPLVRKNYTCAVFKPLDIIKSCSELYQSLVAKGKPKKLTLTAVANKLLKIVFAITRRLKIKVG